MVVIVTFRNKCVLDEAHGKRPNYQNSFQFIEFPARTKRKLIEITIPYQPRNENQLLGPQFFVNRGNKSSPCFYRSGSLERREKRPCSRTAAHSDMTLGKSRRNEENLNKSNAERVSRAMLQTV